MSDTTDTRPTGRELWAIDLGTIEYSVALELQRRIVAAKKRGDFEADLLLLLEHPAVITLGRRGDVSHVLASEEQLARRDIQVHHVERGGDVTYHGPGQLVGYPIVNLKHLPHRKDVGKFVWNMQEAIIRAIAPYGLTGRRIDGVVGVWIQGESPDVRRLGKDRATVAALEEVVTPFHDRKIAAIGARVEGWVSFHGFALNVNTHLPDFTLIIPCGLENRGVTSIEVESGRPADMGRVRRDIAGHLAELWGFELRWKDRSVLAPYMPTSASVEAARPPG